MSVTEPLRAEHAHLRPHLDELDTLASDLSWWDDHLLGRLAASVAFLRDHLLVHAQAEEAALYPAIEHTLDAPGSTATMAADHHEITRRVDQLAAAVDAVSAAEPSAGQVESLKAQLYGLSAILQLHFAKEEDVLLPIIDTHFDENEARDLFAAMAHAAHGDHQDH